MKSPDSLLNPGFFYVLQSRADILWLEGLKAQRAKLETGTE
jgi:hypothetical protein